MREEAASPSGRRQVDAASPHGAPPGHRASTCPTSFDLDILDSIPGRPPIEEEHEP